MDNNKFKNYKCMCIIFLCSAVKAYHASILIQQPHATEVIVGHSTTLKCFLTDSETSKRLNCYYVTWIRVQSMRRTMDVITSNKQYNEQTNSCDLTITTATLEDTGLYYCSGPEAKTFKGNGSKVTVVGNVNPSVELFSPSEFPDPNIPLICWAKGTVPSQVRIFWVVNGEEHIGWTESVWTKQNDLTTEFTQSRFWLSKSDWDTGEQCTCVVEAGGKNISKSIQRPGKDICLFLMYGVSGAALFMIMVSVTTVLVLLKGHRIKEIQEKNRRRLNTGKRGKYRTKKSSVTEVQYASLEIIHFRRPQEDAPQQDLDLETQTA
ncbi:uncharacterized protein LOC116225028 isoform X2 [Clupea harengus]|uniref:Uncharacterized protein LOC116225028 isoform X2 n=1 Tax=Clupea harengus TaxID=7950 RepID=A0A6P8GT77_CLUHA|nr:uncharacterized protein LOC116225028 isoform X2 [Clupea harengus]